MGAAPAVNDLLSGEIQMMHMSLAPIVGHVRAGKLRMLSNAAPKRSVLFTNVPTSIELGYKDTDYFFWIGFSVNAKTPQPIMQRLHRDINATVADREMAERLLKVGAEPLTMAMEDLQVLVKGELETNGALIKTKGFRPE